jgi:D-alanyl-D-alanine endopeptidase (penicillin-binding protein 7)
MKRFFLTLACLVGSLGLLAPDFAHARERHWIFPKGRTASRAATAHKQAVPGIVNHFAESADGEKIALGSASVLVLDQESGQPLLEHNAHAVLPIASVSKLMTAMVVLDARERMPEQITISHEDIDTLRGSSSRLPVGVRLSWHDALLVALMSSENRAAHALARSYPGGVAAFVKAMNRKAWALGMRNTHFEEPTGLSANNVSTAQDLSRMVIAAHQYATIRAYSTRDKTELPLGRRMVAFSNTNALVRQGEWQIGLSKTGYIAEAGRCLVMQAELAGRPVVLVLLDSAGKMTRVGDANRIKHWLEAKNNTDT